MIPHAATRRLTRFGLCVAWSTGALSVAPVSTGAQHHAATGGVAEARSWRHSLAQAEETASAAAQRGGLAAALAAIATHDLVVLIEGLPIVSGKDATRAALARQGAIEGLRVAWEPFRILVSKDGAIGATFGATIVTGPGHEPATMGRYANVWRRNAMGEWQLVAHVQNGLQSAKDAVQPTESLATAARPEDRFALADLAFARMAHDSGAPASFGRFSARTAVTMAPTGELNIGPEAIRARMAEGAAATASWRWWPVRTIAAASGDLGVTIGEADIQFPDGGALVSSKYLTVWQLQADGSMKFVVDLGSGRPRPE